MGQTQEVTLPHSYPETAHALIRSSIHSLTPGDTTYNHKDRVRTFLYRRRLSAINAHQKGPAKEEKQKCLTRQPASLARSMALEHLKTPKRKRRSPFQVLRLFLVSGRATNLVRTEGIKSKPEALAVRGLQSSPQNQCTDHCTKMRLLGAREDTLTCWYCYTKRDPHSNPSLDPTHLSRHDSGWTA